ncbi:TetR family transcriptional regulator [Clostridium zeae]|uniref:TetR family transcriptional regulator n=1 Tax=Clostridium zeae TaxID=2759022 RepID=A0ABQ1EEC5_9CLOT|nr:TetR/AcrR family transcriptional regulator [Clostridium zeae]GFZ33169.1 TetR family transcriptional regulator [Clostridium zeae]
MGKAFSENEYLQIQQKLVKSCEESWSRYGYKKTSIRELCEMSGISTGAFYLFYDSKEALFIDTADKVLERLIDIMNNNMPSAPTKYDFINSLKLVAKEIVKVDWILSLRNDFELLLRKLPKDFFEKSFKNDMSDFFKLINKYGLKPKVSIEEITAVFWTIFTTLQYRDVIGDNYFKAFEFILESSLKDLFE